MYRQKKLKGNALRFLGPGLLVTTLQVSAAKHRRPQVFGECVLYFFFHISKT